MREMQSLIHHFPSPAAARRPLPAGEAKYSFGIIILAPLLAGNSDVHLISERLQPPHHHAIAGLDARARFHLHIIAEAERNLLLRHPLAAEHEYHPLAAALGQGPARNDRDLLAALPDESHLHEHARTQQTVAVFDLHFR